jgi:uncharacterized protein YkwD
MGFHRGSRRALVPGFIAVAVLVLCLGSAIAAPARSVSSAAQDWLSRCFFVLPSLDSATKVYSDNSAARYADDIFEQTNQLRAKKKLRTLQRDPHLDAVAQAHALDMAMQGFFDHLSPQGMDVFDRMESAGCPRWWTGGENIAAGYRTPAIAVKAWMDSPGHRRNVLDGNYEHIGIGAYYAPGSEYGWYWVQVFASYDDDARGTWLEPGMSL